MSARQSGPDLIPEGCATDSPGQGRIPAALCRFGEDSPGSGIFAPFGRRSPPDPHGCRGGDPSKHGCWPPSPCGHRLSRRVTDFGHEGCRTVAHPGEDRRWWGRPTGAPMRAELQRAAEWTAGCRQRLATSLPLVPEATAVPAPRWRAPVGRGSCPPWVDRHPGVGIGGTACAGRELGGHRRRPAALPLLRDDAEEAVGLVIAAKRTGRSVGDLVALVPVADRVLQLRIGFADLAPLKHLIEAARPRQDRPKPEKPPHRKRCAAAWPFACREGDVRLKGGSGQTCPRNRTALLSASWNLLDSRQNSWGAAVARAAPRPAGAGKLAAARGGRKTVRSGCARRSGGR